MQGKWKRRLIVCLKLLTKILIALVSFAAMFLSMLIILCPIALITEGRVRSSGVRRSIGDLMMKIYYIYKTIIYIIIGWLEGVLIYIVGYAKHIGKAIKARDGQMMNPVKFWKVCTSREEFINREKWVAEKSPDKHAQEFFTWCQKTFKTISDYLKTVRAELEKVTMQELQSRCKASVIKRCETLKQSLRVNGREMNAKAESGEVAMLAGSALGTVLVAITEAADILMRSAGIGVGCTLFLVKYLVCYVRYIVLAIWKREERLKTPVAFWWECYRERKLISRKHATQTEETSAEQDNLKKEQAE